MSTACISSRPCHVPAGCPGPGSCPPRGSTLARAGGLHGREQLPTTLLKPGKGPIALRVHLANGAGFDLTEQGTQKRLAVYVVRDPQEVPGIARLGPDPLADGYSLEDFRELLASDRSQIKGLLRDQ